MDPPDPPSPAGYGGPEDYVLMPEPYYAGGTADRSVSAKDIVERILNLGGNAHWFETRDEIPGFIRRIQRTGDRVVVMGARDDTLHGFAKTLLES